MRSEENNRDYADFLKNFILDFKSNTSGHYFIQHPASFGIKAGDGHRG
jgi:hypothetical protein